MPLLKLKPLLALGLTMLAASTQAFGGATLDRVEQNHELVGVLMESYPPFSFLNEQNQLDGFDVDVAKAVAQKLGVKLRLETPSWDVIAAGRWSGRYDICICSMTPSKARAEVFDFPVEYYASPAVIVVNAKDERIHGAKDLSGKKVGLTSASSYESYLNKNLVIEGAEDTQLQYPFENVADRPLRHRQRGLPGPGPGRRRAPGCDPHQPGHRPTAPEPGQALQAGRRSRCTPSPTRWPSKKATRSGTARCVRSSPS